MNRMLCTISLVISANCLLAATTSKDLSPEAKERWVNMMTHTGGPVDKIGKGKIVVVNAQKKASDAIISAIIEKLYFQTRIKTEVSCGDWKMYERPDGASAAIVLVDDPALPVSVIAVENQWGLLNVAKLGTNNFDLRFTKEFVRVTTLAFGGAISQFKGSALNPVRDISMLDRYVCDNYTVDNRDAIIRTLRALGVEPTQRVSYKKACQEGWAPAPTNEYQKAIWDKVHAMPTAPIQIKPEVKKVER